MENLRLKECAVVKDLLPNYMEHLTSEETNELIEEHLGVCVDCAEYRDVCMSDVKLDAVIENKKAGKAFRKARNLWILKGLFRVLLGIAVVTCFIVDLAVSKRLTWSLIVDGGIVLAASIFETAVRSRKHALLNVLACISVEILPFLYLIQQVSNRYFVQPPVSWFSSYALPITLTWLAIGWCVACLWKVLRLNAWNVMGCFFVGALVGSPLTSMYATKLGLLEAMNRNYDWIDMIAYVVIAVVFFTLGSKKKRDR